jgi:biopolymer transport protein ExbD
MKRIFEVCLIAVALVAGSPSVNAQVPPMQKGIIVELPVTRNAVPVPDADHQDSPIVSVMRDGRFYLGVDRVDQADVAKNIKERMANRANKDLYLKGDGRTAYADVLNVLVALRAAGVNAPILLTAQTDSSDNGVIVPPKGLRVSTAPSSTKSPVVHLQDSGSPFLLLGAERLSLADLQSTLEKQFHNQPAEVQLEADGTLPYAQVVRVIDACRSIGVDVAVVTPAL